MKNLTHMVTNPAVPTGWTVAALLVFLAHPEIGFILAIIGMWAKTFEGRMVQEQLETVREQLKNG